jgi:threonine synthase
MTRLAQLGARITMCERRPGEPGDPTVLRMREALADGAIPFTCQGNENGLAIEGGLTLGYELVDQWRELGTRPDHLFVQVGGGALASSVIQALDEAEQLGALDEMPRIHAVQTTNTHPLDRALHLVKTCLEQSIANGCADGELRWVAHHRSDFMWPWEQVPDSIAGGILDDETYDWLAVVRGVLASAGRSVLVDEQTLGEANALATEATGINVDPTGSAGLAGLLELRRRGAIKANETCQVLFTGARR